MSCRRLQMKQIKRELLKMLTFSPPSPPRYEIITNDLNPERGPQYTKCEFILKKIDSDNNCIQENVNHLSALFPWIECDCYQLRKTESKNRIVTIHIKNKSTPPEKKSTILYSHGNSADLGVIFPILVDMSSILKCDIISYDYSGYGQSEGTAAEPELFNDILQVLDFALVNLMINVNKLILFGTSIGSFPSVRVAVTPKYCGVQGLVLLSPIASGNELAKYTEINLEKEDILNSAIIAKEIICPTFIIHGKLDTVIPVEHSMQIAKEIQSVFTWFPNNGTHTNVISLYRSKYYSKLKTFFIFTEENSEKNMKKFRETNINESVLNSTVLELKEKTPGSII